MRLRREEILLRALLMDRDVACPECRYNLRGLTNGKCPECGSPLRLCISATSSRRRVRLFVPGVLIGMLTFEILIASTLVARWLAGATGTDVWLDLAGCAGLLVAIGGYLWSLLRFWPDGGRNG